MKDFLGREVTVGDTVVFTAYNGEGLSKGVIEKVNPKTVVIRVRPGDRWGSTTRKGSEYFIKLLGGAL